MPPVWRISKRANPTATCTGNFSPSSGPRSSACATRQLLTYDFETGGRGYIGGKPGGSLWDKANWGAGVEYGYSLPVGRRLNLDFTVGAGYLGGEYWEYISLEDCYVWQATKRLRWFGPTKAEVSLVWLIGRGNYNNRKGGRR